MPVRQRLAGHELGRRVEDVRPLESDERFALYLAREVGTGREVVIKTAADAAHRWLSELLDDQAEMLAAVGPHPHVVTLLQRFVLDDGRTALVLEQGARRLPELLAERPAADGGGRLPADAVASFGIKLAGALEAVRAAALIHCDVRPATVWCNPWDEPLLARFDEAVHVHPGVDSYPALHSATAYTAPELLVGEAASSRSDVYGLAATLYEMLAGHGAFRAYAGESPAAVVARVLAGRAPTIVLPDVPLALSDLLRWCLEPDPRDRPPTASWVAEELGRIQTTQGWTRTPLLGA